MPEIEKPFRKTGDAAISESPLHPRRKSRRIMVGPVPVGGGAPISVQSMTNTLTADVPATLQQIAELTAAGCDIVRVAVPSQDDADALPEIVKKSPIPVIADIHFQSKYVFQAIDAGCAAVRVNPGNIRKFDEVGPSICKAATDAGISLRIGVNAGSLDKELYAKYGGPTPEALVASAMKEARMFEDVGFHDFKISVKHHDVVTMVQTYRLLASKGDWPLHLGVTEAGPTWQGTIKSCLAFGALLAEGIGDTIRVSLSAPPVEEVKVGCKLLEYMGLRPRKFDIISCPSCGRSQVDVIQLANAVTEGLKDVTAPIRVAVMGCIVNGPGEAREADLGVASGNGKGQIFIKGKVIKTVPEDQIVDTLLTIANDIAAQMEADGQVPVIGGITWEAFQYPAEDGKPNVFVDDINHPSKLTSLLVGDNHLYLFYGRIDVVKVYDLDGQYLYSVNFRDGRDSGGPSYIYVFGNHMVYLPRSTHTAYIFEDDVLTAQESVEYRDVFPKTLFPGVSSYNRQVDSAGNRYQFRLANIVRVAPDGQATTLIRRSPLYCIFGHFSFYWICTLLFFLMLIVPAVIVDMKEKKKQKQPSEAP